MSLITYHRVHNQAWLSLITCCVSLMRTRKLSLSVIKMDTVKEYRRMEVEFHFYLGTRWRSVTSFTRWEKPRCTLNRRQSCLRACLDVLEESVTSLSCRKWIRKSLKNHPMA